MRMVFVHGFTQTARSWDPVVERLPHELDVVAVDVPDGLDFAATATAIGAQGGTATYVGYSMGGRLCLALALDRPDQVERLVLISASPGIADAHERAARAAADEQLARDVARDGVDTFLDRWLAQPLFASLPRETARADERARNNSVARIAHQLRALGQGVQPSLWPRLAELAMPTLLVTGSSDDKYRDIAAAMARAIGDHARTATVGAGHAVHLEQPDAIAALLRTL